MGAPLAPAEKETIGLKTIPVFLSLFTVEIILKTYNFTTDKYVKTDCYFQNITGMLATMIWTSRDKLELELLWEHFPLGRSRCKPRPVTSSRTGWTMYTVPILTQQHRYSIVRNWQFHVTPINYWHLIFSKIIATLHIENGSFLFMFLSYFFARTWRMMPAWPCNFRPTVKDFSVLSKSQNLWIGCHLESSSTPWNVSTPRKKKLYPNRFQLTLWVCDTFWLWRADLLAQMISPIVLTCLDVFRQLLHTMVPTP